MRADLHGGGLILTDVVRGRQIGVNDSLHYRRLGQSIAA